MAAMFEQTEVVTAGLVPDPMLPVPYRIQRVRQETDDTFTLEILPEDSSKGFCFAPGQFNMLYVFGVGEVPISISSDPDDAPLLKHTTRVVGTVTKAMRKLKRGEVMGIRGPFGSHWPVGSGGGPHQPGFGLEDPRGQRVAIGVLADSPFLFFRAPDGEKRMSMDLSIFEKPMLWMGDETGPRMSLGVEQSDTPGPLDRNWALDFGPNTARIGMFAERVEGKTYVRGLFSVNRDRVLYPYPYEQPK